MQRAKSKKQKGMDLACKSAGSQQACSSGGFLGPADRSFSCCCSYCQCKESLPPPPSFWSPSLREKPRNRKQSSQSRCGTGAGHLASSVTFFLLMRHPGGSRPSRGERIYRRKRQQHSTQKTYSGAWGGEKKFRTMWHARHQK